MLLAPAPPIPVAATPAAAAEAPESEASASRQAAEEHLRRAAALAAEGSAESRAAAIEAYAEAARTYRGLGDPWGEAEGLAGEAGVLRATGQADLALERTEAALALPSDDLRQRAGLLHLAGVLHSRRGDQRAAIEHLRQALDVLATAPPDEGSDDRMSSASMLNSLGAAHQRLGEQQEAIDAFRQVLAVTRELGIVAGEAASLTNLANSHYQLGETEEARRLYGQVLELRRAQGDTAGEARILSYLAWTAATDGQHAEAVDRFEEALVIHRQVGDRRAEADSLAGAAFALAALDRWPESLQRSAAALALAEELGERRIAANSLITQGIALEGRGRRDEALGAYRRALELSRRSQDRWTAADSLARAARLHRDADDLAAARQDMEEALQMVETLRRDVTREELRTSFLASNADYYAFLVDVLMDLDAREPGAGHAEAALTVHERARARSLLDLLTEAGADIRQGVDPELLAAEEELLAEIEAAEERLATTREPATGDGEAAADDPRTTADELAALLDRYQELLATLRARSPRYAALAEPEPLSAAQIRTDLLDPDTVLLEIALGEERSHLWVVEADGVSSDGSSYEGSGSVGVSSYVLPPRAEIEAAAEALHRSLGVRNRSVPGESPAQRRARHADADAEAERRAAALTAVLLRPAAGHLRPGRRLVVVADGALRYVPFALLPHPTAAAGDGSTDGAAPPLLVHHEVVNLPSASVLAVLRREAAQRPRPRGTLAVLADPVFAAGDPRLASVGGGDRSPDGWAPGGTTNRGAAIRAGGDDTPFRRLRFSAREAERIAALVPADERWVAHGFNAARSAVTSGRLAEYRMVHFATHAVIDDDEPHRTGLVLSMLDAAGRPANGFLRLHDIYQLDLAADLVTLSACETAHGREIRGEGLVGLVRGFMYAGGERVVASQWSVEDRATAVLMEHFYRAVLEEGLSPAAALRAAQLELRADPRWSAPYYWAPFILQGEWR